MSLMKGQTQPQSTPGNLSDALTPQVQGRQVAHSFLGLDGNWYWIEATVMPDISDVRGGGLTGTNK